MRPRYACRSLSKGLVVKSFVGAQHTLNLGQAPLNQQYLSRFTQFQDELGSIGITVAKDGLVSLALLLPSQELAQLLGFGKWEGQSTKLGEPLVGFGAGGVQVEH